MTQWQELSHKYLLLTAREKYLILLTGVVVIFMIIDNYVLTVFNEQNSQIKKQMTRMAQDNVNVSQTVADIQQQLRKDPNKALREQIAEYKQQIATTDKTLLTLTSELIDPIEMRLALQDLLKKQQGIRILAFQTLSPELIRLTTGQPLEEEQEPENIGLYRHGITLTLTGRYFELRNYLTLIETLPWQFFWHRFEFESKEYPMGELKLEIYSLSRKQEFLGV